MAVAFEEGRIARGDGQAVIQRLAAVGLGRGWPVSLAAPTGAT
jgi:hypothetical protein